MLVHVNGKNRKTPKKQSFFTFSRLSLSYRAIGCIMSTLFYPIITFLLLALCIAYWAVTAVYPNLKLIECLIKIA